MTIYTQVAPIQMTEGHGTAQPELLDSGLLGSGLLKNRRLTPSQINE
jgi:hypothetical protein